MSVHVQVVVSRAVGRRVSGAETRARLLLCYDRMRSCFAVALLLPIAACVSALPGESVRVIDAGVADAPVVDAADGSTPREAGVDAPPLAPLRGVRSIVAGESHTCVLLDDGTVRCWGKVAGPSGALPVLAPVPVPGITNAVQVAAGPDHTCALLGDGRVLCSRGVYERARLELEGVVSVAAGASFTCAVFADRTARCGSAVPLAGVTTIAAGYDFACATLTDSTARCWGANMFGQLGSGAISDRSDTPVPVMGDSGFVAMAANNYRACAILGSGTVSCWGFVRYSHEVAAAPTTVAAIGDAVQIAVGGNHACVVLANGAVRCWGAGFLGQLGDGGRVEWTPAPSSDVPGIAGARAVATGITHSCVALSDGTARCWGTGYLGNNTLSGTSLVPVVVVAP